MGGSGGRESCPTNGAGRKQELLAAWNSMKEKKRMHEQHNKLKGQVALQREILAKAASRKQKKAVPQPEKKATRQVTQVTCSRRSGQEGQKLRATRQVRG